MKDTATLVAVLGTRPEIVKFAPVLRALGRLPQFAVRTVVTGQQPDLLPAFLTSLGIQPHRTLAVMVPGQTVGSLLRASLQALAPVVRELRPHAILVQGDTTTALAGALVGACEGVPVAHIEAGLRTGDPASPFPEEINRTLITHAASLHCAPTAGNVQNLLGEGIGPEAIVLTGNPVVDAVTAALPGVAPSASLAAALKGLQRPRRILLTAHRRENFGARLDGYLRVIREFMLRSPEVALLFPVHPNPAVVRAANTALRDVPGVALLEPLAYRDFLYLLKSADLVLSDSGGVQEEIAVAGVPLYILREKTERPEILATGLARLAATPQQLEALLRSIAEAGRWPAAARLTHNPFGDSNSGMRVARAIARWLLP